jgi:hypothetical protein
MCSICNAGTLLASVKARINLTDSYPAIMAGFAGSEDPFVFAVKQCAQCAQVHNVRSAYVNNALACLRP